MIYDNAYFQAIRDAQPILDAVKGKDRATLLNYIKQEWIKNLEHDATKQGRFEASMLRGENVIPENIVDPHASTPFNEMCNRIDAEYYARRKARREELHKQKILASIRRMCGYLALQLTLWLVYTLRLRELILEKLKIDEHAYNMRLCLIYDMLKLKNSDEFLIDKTPDSIG